MGASSGSERPAISVWYFSYWSGVPEPGLSVIVRDHTAVFAFPTNDDLFSKELNGEALTSAGYAPSTRFGLFRKSPAAA